MSRPARLRLNPRPSVLRSGLLILGLLSAPSLLRAARAVDYTSEIKPLLTRHCVACHGADQHKGGLRLDTAAAARRGGDLGPAFVPGSPAGSLVIQAVEGTRSTLDRMPYKRPPLPPEDLARLRRWIEAGAPAPDAETPGRQVHWAFVPPVRPTIPASANPAFRASHPVDAFVRAQLESASITPSPEADRATLLRRLHLDLTGLPPTPEQTDAFLRDPAPDAYERRVEELLKSPHHGERWGRWWLDVARYSDSNGYSVDAPRTLWPWRDWVIEAFNSDLPFDHFTVEQLAGDLLPDATISRKIATGFHRNTQINQEGGIDPEQFRIESVLDRVNTTGTAFLGLTIACAQCHDHKFDPLTQREFYQLFAFFNQQDEPSLPVPSPEHRAELDQHARRRLDLEAKRTALQDAPGDDAGKERSRLDAELARLDKAKPQPPSTLVLAERTQRRETFLFVKGDFTRRGPDVTPGTPAILHPFRPAPRRSPSPTNAAARVPDRLDLARWIVDPANPLTARVIVNRVWQQYFGRGLVETENDFGTQGSPPSHPDLLDWLATELIARQWSLKAMHRLIVTSATYRQSSRVRPDLAEKDPGNRLLARQTRLRLDAEIVRDVALAASGRLNPKVGGPGVYPPQPDGVMNLGQSRREWKASAGPDRFRRGVYTFHWRATPHPALSVFDAPDAFSACTRRPRSNTPLQALTLLNDAAFVELAEALAARVAAEALPESRSERLFRLCLARPPAPAELARLHQLLHEERALHGERAAWQTAARVVLNLDETITRE